MDGGVSLERRLASKNRYVPSTPTSLIVDILCIPFENWGAALIYFTGKSSPGISTDWPGNDIVRRAHQFLLIQFNRSLRLFARKSGYSLNQRGLSTGIIRGKDGLKQTEGTL